MAITAGDVKVEPASSAWTEFNVTDVEGTVRIAARKGDVTVSDGKGTVTLAQGQETTRDESSDNSSDNGKRKNRKRRAGASPGASGGALNSPIAIGVAGAAALGITTWVLIQSAIQPARPSPNSFAALFRSTRDSIARNSFLSPSSIAEKSANGSEQASRNQSPKSTRRHL